MSAVSVADELGIHVQTAQKDMTWVRKEYTEVVLNRMQAKLVELLEASIDITDPEGMDTKELLRAMVYARPPIQKAEVDLKAEVAITWSPTKPSGE